MEKILEKEKKSIAREICNILVFGHFVISVFVQTNQSFELWF